MTDAALFEMPTDLEQRTDPYELLNKLRDAGPVHHVRLRTGSPGWLVTGYDEVMAALHNPSLSNDPLHVIKDDPDSEMAKRKQRLLMVARSMVTSDQPDHTRLRGLVSRAYTARRVEQLRPRIQEITDELLDAVAPLGKAEMVEALAFPLTVAMMCELLGIPYEDRDEFQRWSVAMLKPSFDKSSVESAKVAHEALAGYLAKLAEQKREDPKDDLLSAMAAARDDEQRLTDKELVSTAVLLFIAGHETSVNLLGTGLYNLLRHPDQLEALRADQGLLPGAVEELLRYDGPVTVGLFRYTKEDVEIAGVRIPKGQQVVLSLGAANRDPSQFDRPDELDVTRERNPHLGYGHGIHFCIGAALARVEAQIAIGTLLDRLPDIRLAVPADEIWFRASALRGVAELPVSFTPQPA